MKKVLILSLFVVYFGLVSCSNNKVTKPAEYDITIEDLPNGGEAVVPGEENREKIYEIYTVEATVNGTNSTVWSVKEGDVEFLQKIWGAILTNNKYTYNPQWIEGVPDHMALANGPDWDLYSYRGKVKSILRGGVRSDKSFYGKDKVASDGTMTLERQFKGVKIVAIPSNYGGEWAGKYTVAGIYTVREKFTELMKEKTQEVGYDEGLIFRADVEKDFNGKKFFGAQFIWKPNTTIDVSSGSDFTYSDYTKSAMRSSYYFTLGKEK